MDREPAGAVADAHEVRVGRHAAIVDHLEQDGPKSATLQVAPA